MKARADAARGMFVSHYDEILQVVESVMRAYPVTAYEAGDIMSDLFIKCHEKAQYIPVHDAGEFIAFMKVVAKNRILQVMNHEFRHSNGMEYNDRTMSMSDDPKDGPFELRHSIAALLMGIPKKQRSALFFYASGYDYKEIAQFLSVPLGTVQSRIHHARLAVMSGEWVSLRYASA